MSEGQLQRSVASSAQHRQEAEVVVAEERERAATETAATTTRAAKLAMVELAVARAEVEAAAAVDAARVAAAELEALRGSSTSSSISIDGGTDEGGSVRAGGIVGSCAPQGRGGGSPDGCGRADGWVNGDRVLYKRHDSPSLDRYHGHRGILVIVRDIGPGGGWHTLTKTNYVEWAMVMRI
jgi:membrane protein involved in colicin uptake